MKYLFIVIIALLVGFAITRFVKKSMQSRAWVFPVLLGILPVFYALFAFWINDKNALKNEVIIASIFAILIVVYIKNRKLWAEKLLASGFLMHAIYDVTHSWYFENLGIPNGWPVFCSILNLFLGAYIFYLYRQRVVIRV